jgi:hypothetical protein
LLASVRLDEQQLQPIFQFPSLILVPVFLVTTVAGWRTEEEKFGARKLFLSCRNSLQNCKQVHISYSKTISFLPPIKTEMTELFARLQYQEGD